MNDRTGIAIFAAGPIALALTLLLADLAGMDFWVALTFSVIASAAITLWAWRFNRRQIAAIEHQLHDTVHSVDQWQDRWAELQAESHQNATVLSRMADGIVVLSPDMSIQLLNPSARKLLGLRDDDPWLGSDFREVFRHPDMIAAVRAVLQGDKISRASVEISDVGKVRPVSIVVNRIDSRQTGNLLLTIHDETEARRLEEVRREFIANVSHELKTPLAAIKGYAETVELAIEDDPQAANYFMQQISVQCLRLEQLVADMMQLARAQAGSDKLEFSDIRLGGVISEAIKTYVPVAQARQITLSQQNLHSTAKVHADREAVLTIINNLIGNAIRYTDPGGNVCVRVTEPADGGGRVGLVVQDDGIGIASDQLDRIFERFYRVDKTRESAVGGTGLGLSIVKNLANACGAEVTVASQLGEGATFTVMLPIGRTKVASEDTTSAPQRSVASH